jgi:hypothetical protein
MKGSIMKQFTLELTIEADSEEEAIAIARHWIMTGDPSVRMTAAARPFAMEEEVTQGVEPAKSESSVISAGGKTAGKA